MPITLLEDQYQRAVSDRVHPAFNYVAWRSHGLPPARSGDMEGLGQTDAPLPGLVEHFSDEIGGVCAEVLAKWAAATVFVAYEQDLG